MYTIDNGSTFSVSEVSQSELPMFESGICTHVFLEDRVSPSGDPFFTANVLNDKTGKSSKFLIDRRDYSELQSSNLIGLRVNFEIRSNGLKIKRLEFQPKETIKFLQNLRPHNQEETIPEESNENPSGRDIEKSKNFIEDLVISFTQRSHELGLPTFIGVCIPEEKK